MMKLWRELTGQVLMELAIFGSILIMLLGVLVNYGLRYNGQQRMMQESFSKAYKSAGDWGRCPEGSSNCPSSSVSYALIKDKHIPDPADMWGIGQVSGISSSSGGITRSYDLNAGPSKNKPNELPKMKIILQSLRNGQPEETKFTFKTAGYLDFENVNSTMVKKYNELYGASNVFWDKDSDNARVIDPFVGEIVDYAGAIRQCRQFINPDVCSYECEKAKPPDSEKDCLKICSYEVEIPWYCEGHSLDSKVTPNPPKGDNRFTRYVFPRIEELFALSRTNNPNLKAMGLGQDQSQVTRVNNRLEKSETNQGITTTDTVDWRADTTRKIVHNKALDEQGVSLGRVELEEVEAATTVLQNKIQQQDEDWDRE